MMSCEQHDYIEIACLYRYTVTLTLVSGEQVSGVALDTARNEHRAECLKIRIGDEVRLLPLASLTRMTAAAGNPHFQTVAFD
ncbi:Rho-binding antiterminator [Oceanimonas marisflavi]|uniref:Rho-binding antiterminator n=1 Tax=Oceanimonas marisflavi TaxID=2059724 RepID=UPI000D2F92F2|nr:Rho-binding antiterminator [Oceanimonas marisflavi]